MSKYGTLLFEADEHYTIGPFRFPVYHDLVPGELRCLQQLNKRQSQSVFASMKLAKKIATEKGISPKEAINLLGNVGSEENENIVFDYIEEIEEVNSSQLDEIDLIAAQATIMIQMRGELENKTDPKLALTYVKVPDWTEADTAAVPTKLLRQIVQFIEWERDGWPATPESGAGKPPEPTPTELSKPQTVK